MKKKKKISINIPVFNEVENVPILVERIREIFNTELSMYDYEIIFAENKSTDGTRELVVSMAMKDKHIKAVLNSSNVGTRSGYNTFLQTTGDCTITMAGDLQDPPELIPQFVQAWEDGYKIVIGIKTKSEENRFVYKLRGLYYKLLNKISNIDQIPQFTGFGLYDKKWMDFLRQINDPIVYIRGLVSEYGFERKEIEFTQPKRQHGKSKSNFMYLYGLAMRGITSNSELPLRIATIVGFFLSMGSFAVGIIYLILKLTNWYAYPAGTAPILIITCFIGAIILFFIGLLGEYIMNINKRVMNYPLVLEERRINFDNNDNAENTSQIIQDHSNDNVTQSRKDSLY